MSSSWSATRSCSLLLLLTLLLFLLLLILLQLPLLPLLQVREMYEKITTKIEVEDNSSSSVSVTYTSDCNRRTEKKRTKCRNIPLGTPVTFTAHVTLK